MTDVNELFFQAFENNPSGMTISDAETGKFQYVNNAFIEIFGYTREEIIGKTSLDLNIINPSAREKIFAKLKKHGVVKDTRILVRKKNGESFWAISTTQILGGDKEQFVVTNFYDITDQEKKRQLSLNTNKFLESVLENIPNMVFVKDAKELRFVLLNKVGEELLGYSQLDLIGKSDYDFFPKEQADYFVAKDRKTLAKKIVLDIPEEFIETKKGNRILHTKKITITDDNNKPIYLLGISEDITEKKAEEKKIIEQRDQIARLLEFQNIILNGTDYSIITTQASDGIITSFNKGAENMYGYKAEEVVGIINPSIFFDKAELQAQAKILSNELCIVVEPGPDVLRVKSRITNCIDTNEWTCIHKDGSKINVELSMSALRDSENNVIAYLGISKDITASKKIRDSVLKAKEAAEQANLLKDTFLANMSHEIRTPMNAIIGYTDLLLKKNLPPREHEYVEVIKNSGENLLRIVNDILDYSKIESGIITFEFYPISIKEIFSSLNAMLLNKAQDHHIYLSFNCGTNLPNVVLGDQTRVTQILLNLINNAIKFTKRGSVEVFVKIIKEENEFYLFEFSIKDTGIGIPKDELENIFERFRQAELSTTRKYGGTGLGLSIAKQLVELQGGKIEVHSKLGVGSEFVFTLPLKKTTKTHLNPESDNKYFNVYEMEQLNVLLAEDNPVNVKFVLSLFSEYNITHIDIAENGRQIIDRVKNGAYDIVLMDIEMPEINGYEATAIIRNKLKNNVPIIAMTAHAIAGEKEKCLQCGMTDFISKPIQADVLFEKIHNAVSSKINTTNYNERKNKLVNLSFLFKSMRGKKDVMQNIIDVFLKQVPEDLFIMNEAVIKTNYLIIKNCAHKMKSTVSVFGILDLLSVLEEMEALGKTEGEIGKIKLLNEVLNKKCEQAIEELKQEKLSNYQ
jgi:PAS domain S-box-containing protein